MEDCSMVLMIINAIAVAVGYFGTRRDIVQIFSKTETPWI